MIELEKDFLGSENILGEETVFVLEEPVDGSFFKAEDFSSEEEFVIDPEIPTIDEVRNVNRVSEVPAYRKVSLGKIAFGGSLVLGLAFLGGCDINTGRIVEKEGISLSLGAVEEKNSDDEFVVDSTGIYEKGLLEEDGSYVELIDELENQEEVLTRELKTVENREARLGDFVDMRVVNILNIMDWENYELVSIERIEPTSYVPRLVSYVYYDNDGKSGVLSPRLYIIPTQRGGYAFDKQLPVLEYSLVPAIFQALEISELYKISTPEGGEIVFGTSTNTSSKTGSFNGKIFVPMWLITPDGVKTDFMFPEENPKETLSLQQSLWRTRGKLDLSFCFWPEKVILSSDLETRDFQELLDYYDPELLRFGNKYASSDVVSFLKIFEGELAK